MAKYLLFYGDHYYPNGGLGDLKGRFDTIEEAQAALSSKHKYSEVWANIADYETLQVVDVLIGTVWYSSMSDQDKDEYKDEWEAGTTYNQGWSHDG